ncbi:hypothetical protein APY04_1887 [Hyphomicrobium sulfonivorans]|uniref:Uncharacterized protein n=1 Tax=Hyphomicrobium sulfonivorans TaxID=121290 RepID=A0A120CVB1_HYPSL|nr:cbb3-type cytochrome c oxidase subunit 3 [Hyphomicrobium sulfonivorans]KWT67528.1 hypothetical protein APY04_1887 [Hyphomicrobium sulfonivorans]
MSNQFYAMLEAWWPVFGIVPFLAIVLYVMRPGAKAKAEYKHDAEIPFEDGKDDRNGK